MPDQLIPQSPYTAMLSGQNPAAILQLSSKTAANTGQTASNLTPYQKFGMSLLDMLKQQQAMGTAQFTNASLQGQQEQASRIMEQATPGMSPGLQSQIRQASSSAMTPVIQGSQQMGKTFGEQISGLGTAIGSARDFLSTLLDDEQKKQNQAQTVLFELAKSGQIDNLDSKELNVLAKTAGISPAAMKTIGTKYTQDLKLERQKSELEIQKLKKEISAVSSGGGVGLAGATFEERLQKEVENAFNGIYGTGSNVRENIVNSLSTEFKNIKDPATIRTLVYSRLPDNWEKGAKSTIKPPTDAQAQSVGYGKRMAESSSIIDTLQNTIQKMSSLSFLTQSNLPNMMKSSDMQQLDQAERNFINAVLRKESGAAIAETEFDSAAKQYFPQPGDSKETIEQKRKNRVISTKNLFFAGGDSSLAVRDKKTGKTGWIQANEFDPDLYEII